MKPRHGAVTALLLLATCNQDSQSPNKAGIEGSRMAIGKVPPSEVATWKQVGGTSLPGARYLQAVAFDETRKVVVLFGGATVNPNYGTFQPNQETWEWSPASGKWANRTVVGAAPEARSGAVMVFDSARNKIVLFGGRSGSGYNFEDTWEYDTTTSTWTNVSMAGSHPSARCQQVMAYEKSTGKVLLFGGGRSDVNSYNGAGIAASLGETWEWDASTGWTQIATTGSPSGRHDSAMVWDTARNLAVLFGGMQTEITGASGVPKQDTWEYDPAAHTWTERTTSGSKPSQRYGHAMAYDNSRSKVVLFGGWDINTGASKADLWDWDPATASWKQRLSGSESDIPSPRIYASMVWNESQARLLLIAGLTGNDSNYKGPFPPGYFPGTGSRDVWEIDPSTAACTDRTLPTDVPQERTNHAMAYNPATDKTYVFGGYDIMGQPLNDLWAWDGSTWSQETPAIRPDARADAGLAYDPARKSLILFGGTSMWGSNIYGDTWEWKDGKWAPLSPSSSPDPLYGHGMVTDTSRDKILLFGGQSNYAFYPVPIPGPGGPAYRSPLRNEVWEWDGANMTWTNRTPVASSTVPTERMYPTLAYDEGRKKLFLYDGSSYAYSFGQGLSAYWEWDPLSRGWSLVDPGDNLDYGYTYNIAYDSIRRREIILTDATASSSSQSRTWELDSKGPTWYVRSLPSAPPGHYYATMAYDSGRGVTVLFGGISNGPMGSTYSNDTWEYTVTNLGNGEGCTAASAGTCASGNCVDGVCCESASCTGPCKSCNVAGSEGTCVLASAGTEVAGSCSNGQACDGNGNCKSGNGQACSSEAGCASGYCVDGVCCDGACLGPCQSCNLSGQAGKCSPYPAGTDPANECGKGTGVCKSTCDGVGACTFPAYGVSCGECLTCDGAGTCGMYDPFCYLTGGAGGNIGGAGGSIIPRGGAGGTITGGVGGTITTARGGTTGTTSRGGAGGTVIGGTTGTFTTSRGGAGGNNPNTGGAGGTVQGGTTGTTARGGSGGFVTSTGGAIGGMTGTFTTARGGSGGSGGTSSPFGSGGAAGSGPDAGHPTVGDAASSDAITSAYLHRSGCSCEVGQASGGASNLTSALLLAIGATLAQRLRRRRRR
jgi:hypothetical protein